MLRPGGQPGEGCRQRPQNAAHQAEGALDQHTELFVGLVGVGEEPGQHVQQHLVTEVEQLGDPARGRIGQQWLRLTDVERLPGERRDDRPGGLEARVLLT